MIVMIIRIVDVEDEPKCKASAPNWLAAGFQLFVKIFRPSALNHDEACWLVVTAIRTRITSTSRPAASATTWKERSPSGRRCDRARAAPPPPPRPACGAAATPHPPSRVAADAAPR